ncbi:MAG TPA: hypothetical protein VFI46_01235 [Jiangellaceae bacterium]|nr:hypothetical protein [Jiangellaceae bacterium]
MAEERNDRLGPQAELEAQLRQLGRKLEVPAAPDYATRVRERLASDPPTTRPATWRRRIGPLGSFRPLVAASIVLLLAVAIVLSVPSTREAVAELFGFTGVRVRTLPTAAPSPRTTLDADLDLGEPVTLDQAREQVSFPVSVPSDPDLGAPDAVYVRNERGLESVSLVYRPRPGFPAGADAQVGLLVSEYSGTARPYFEKLINSGVSMTRVTVAARWPGLYFDAPHEILVRSPDGIVHADRPRLVAPTLLWVQGDVTYRMEGNVDLERALAVASTFE